MLAGVILISVMAGVAAGALAYALAARVAAVQEGHQLQHAAGRGSRRKGGATLWPGLLRYLGSLLVRSGNGHVVRWAEQVRSSFELLGPAGVFADPAVFIGLQLCTAFAAALVALVLFGLPAVLVSFVFAAAGWYLPAAFLRDTVRRRHREIFRAMPDFLDLLAIMAEAGLDFPSSLNRIIAASDTALTRELALMQQEVQLGKNRLEALRGLGARVRSPHLNTMITALITALTTGTAMAPALQSLSVQFRVEAFQAAEKSAAEAPLKLMLPLVLLIFPTVFIILFGPVILSFAGSF